MPKNDHTQNHKQELLRLERRFWQAMLEKDADAALELTDDPCILTGAQGVARIDKKKFAAMLTGATWEMRSFELTDEDVRMLGDDVAIVAYKIREDLVVDGKPLSLEASDASTWIRRGGRWLCALHTESLTGDPFGRDRQAMRAPESRMREPTSA